MKTLRIIHSPSRSGGTLMCKSIATMQNVELYSEIHPQGPTLLKKYQRHPVFLIVNIRAQAFTWFNHYSDDQKNEIWSPTDINNAKAHIDELVTLCEARGHTMVIRDWSHIDFFGEPYCQPQFKPQLLEELQDSYEITSTVTARHPIGMWLSFQTSDVLKIAYSNKDGYLKFLKHYLEYAKYFLDQGFVKYEDFVSDRDGTAEKMCKALNMKFDPTYKDRFDGYKNITGDSAASGKTSYRSASRVINSTLFGQLKAEPDYTALCELLGYDPESMPYGYTVS